MKLEGSLDAFSLPDIFQLLSFTKKTGGLHLQRSTARGCVYFTDGAVTGAIADDRTQALARRAVGSGAIDDALLSAAVDTAVEANGTVGVCRALLDGGADADLLRDLASEHVVDAVFDLLRWEDGDFSFTVDDSNPDDVGVALGVDEVVSDARGRVASWDAACQLVPSPDAIPALPIAVTSDPALSRSEWSLLALVDGSRRVSDIVALTGRGDYAVVSALATLVDRGLVVMGVDGDGAGPGSAELLARRLAVLAALEGDADRDMSAADPAPVAEAPPDAPANAAQVDAAPPAATHEPQPAPFAPAAEPVTEPAVSEAGSRSVTPSRPEPFRAVRRPEYPEPEHAAPRPVFASQTGGMSSTAGAVAAAAAPATIGNAAMATDPTSLIERDPSVNKSLLLRLIAGVRGL